MQARAESAASLPHQCRISPPYSPAKHLSQYPLNTPSQAAAQLQGVSAPCAPPALEPFPYASPSISGRDLAMPYAERVSAGLQGILPPTEADLATEMERVMVAFERAGSPLQKYQVLMNLSEADPPLFYALLQAKLDLLLPLLYTPTVGEACLQWGTLLPRPAGLYISYHRHRGDVRAVVDTWPENQVKIAVITDGERILGLGDLGAHGMGIPVGKSVVYGGAGVDPRWVLPVTVDVGTNNASLLKDSFYCGTRDRRIPDLEYYPFMEEVCGAIQARYGKTVLIHWEDVSSKHSFPLLDQLSSASQPTFNDDIQCTAVVTLAALLGATRLPGVPALPAQRVLFFGAGQSNLGGAQLLCDALQSQGLSSAQAQERIWMMDSKGLITSDREKLSPEKAQFAKALPSSLSTWDTQDLQRVIQALKPTALIGAAAQGGAFTQGVIQAMVSAAEQIPGSSSSKPGRPAVFALSNPTQKAECTFEQANTWSRGRVVFASGTQFPPLRAQDATGQAQTRVAAQANNCYVFPGLALGCVASATTRVTPECLLAAAAAIAGQQCVEDLLATECVLPPLKDLQSITKAVKEAVVLAALQGISVSPGLYVL